MEVVEYAPADLLLENLLQGRAVGGHLGAVLLRAAALGLTGHPVGLEVHHHKALFRCKETVHHALEKQVLPPGALSQIVPALDQKREAVLPPQALCPAHLLGQGAAQKPLHRRRIHSGPLLLRYAVQTLWRLPCRITGVMAGTTSASAPEGDAAAPFITSGLLGAYLFDAATNRDLWRFHNAARGHNLYFELLLSAPEPSLQGFYLTPSGAPHLVYRRPPRSAALTRQIQQGALDFIRQFTALEQRLGYELPISGRDAYAPMLQLLKQKNYLKDWEVYLDEPGV